jgi:predicted O-linked N-acetylglucosamine transferase (SPINDLY family)
LQEGGRVQPTQPEKDALIALFREGRHAEANAAARAMTRRFPRALDGWNIRGASARALGQLSEAEKSFRELARLAPDFAGAPYNLGLVLEDRGADRDAATAYARAIELDAGLAQAHNNLGSVLMRLGDLAGALTHLERAALFQPRWPEVHNSHANALKSAFRIEEARAAYGRAIAARPDFARAHYNLGVLESEFGDRTAAIASLRRALEIEPDNALARATLVGELAHTCDWEAMAEHRRLLPDLGYEGAAIPPFLTLALEDDPARQQARSRRWARQLFGKAASQAKPCARPLTRPERLRIGYVGGDYHDHPGARLTAGLLREHDRSRFEIHAISYGPRRDDRWRAEAERSVDHFHDIHGQTPDDALAFIRALDLDIALDRQGYTTGTRSDLFARRLAPLQVNYMGYPSTMGADFMDYMVADAQVIPAQQRRHYDERLILLPHTYAPADNALEIAAKPSVRADHGLPDDALVLVCFNSLYKLTAEVFAIWMRILRQVEGSVLWLFGSDLVAQANLRAAARANGVEPERLVFAQRLPSPEHLERHAHADLFLDTWPCNAHTTCSDALWAGLPVVTRTGEQFASRVAASLLGAVGLPELVTRSSGEYEALILELAHDEGKRLAIRERLGRQRERAPLFNTALYTRHLEAGFEIAYDRFFKGKPPADVKVPVIAGGAPR